LDGAGALLNKTLVLVRPIDVIRKKEMLPIPHPHINILLHVGGPGSGKGTQCVRIASDFGFAHLSAGDLLRSEISTGSEKGELILNIIKEGKIVPSEITVELIRKAMESSDAKRVLIDGFPRCEENRIAFERITGTEPDLVIFFDCPEDEMVKRLLGRNQVGISTSYSSFWAKLH
jgi:adenylate kinase family enzyme